MTAIDEQKQLETKAEKLARKAAKLVKKAEQAAAEAVKLQEMLAAQEAAQPPTEASESAAVQPPAEPPHDRKRDAQTIDEHPPIKKQRGGRGTAKEAAAVSADTPPAKRTYKEAPCHDEGRWGADGDWVYPADRQIECAICTASFTFTGTDQAWYAKRGLYAPARCAECLATKKEEKASKQKSGKSGEGRCFRCGQMGHGSAECTTPRSEQKMCYLCGSAAHLSRNCPDAGKKKGASGCFVCGSTAHLSKECPAKPPPVCFNCGDGGHAQKACPKPLRTEGVCFAFAKGQCFRRKCEFTHADGDRQ